jgi:hypothetical protein
MQWLDFVMVHFLYRPWCVLTVDISVLASLRLRSPTEGDSDEEIVSKLGGAVRLKKAALGGHASPADIASHSSDNRPMILIGG